METSDELAGTSRRQAGHELGSEITATEARIIDIVNDGSVSSFHKQLITDIVKDGCTASSPKQLQKVPRELREKEKNKGFFDPRVISIGPYHHGNPKLKEAEKLKTRAVCGFVAGNKVEPHVIYKKMLDVVSDARNCYLEGSTGAYDDEKFAGMMLLDACFILHFIFAVLSDYRPFISQVIRNVGKVGYRAIMEDISLMENQLPFLVLQALISTTSTDVQHNWVGLIEDFIAVIYIGDYNTMGREQTYKDEIKQPLHFLDLIRRRFIGQYSQSDEEERSSMTKVLHQVQPRPRFPCWPKRGHMKIKPVKDLFGHSFRSATELKARGIHFRPSTTFLFNDFTFTSWFGYGRLTLPQLTFWPGIKYWLLNMIAYELAPTSDTMLPKVCNYIYFMNSLINGTEDVIELRSHNIIHNFYGTDEEVAKAFNSIATDCAYLLAWGPIKGVRDGIQKHYDSKMRTWIAQLLHTYFNTPWSALAFFAATFALAMTVIKTFFPSFRN
ncbi:UPF0481 protein At3g47200-like [Cornus florida]|uniref:UPF0481 protein At3g47200-like n=1 Tax=Cornus florida TaxID=4283 RepID=UPI0028A17772|nr:UPF0481 protein At3g47200-like [Cornus florida]